MNRFSRSLILTAFLASGTLAQTPDAAPWSLVPDDRAAQSPVLLAERNALGLPGTRPRMTMSVPLDDDAARDRNDDSAFSWSLKTWQLNTASLAHIQCNRATLTMDSYLAQDCRFVNRPLPDNSINLVQVRGDWMAAPGLQLGMSAFRSDRESSPAVLAGGADFLTDIGRGFTNSRTDLTPQSVEGLDFNVSFGLQTDRVGDFLVGLQLARYRQRMSMTEFGIPTDLLTGGTTALPESYGSSAELMLGWRRGSFSGEVLGYYRESPLWLDGQTTNSTLNAFDLEFSWHAPHNASISIGVSNIMDAAPRADEPGSEAGLEDAVENVYGRIPYVRYKQDL